MTAVSTDSTPERRLWLRRSVAGDAWAVLHGIGRVFVRHWPVLAALSLAGVGAREGLKWVAEQVGHTNAVAGLLIFILGPIAIMASIVAMLRVVRGSLPWLSTAPTTRERSLDAIGSMLLPFLAVYASYGYLQADRSDYYYLTVYYYTGSTSVPLRISATLVWVIVTAIALRWGLGRWAWAARHRWIGFVRAYLEIVWIGIGAEIIEPLREAGWSWLTERRFVAWGLHVTDRIEQLGTPAHRVMTWLGGLFDSADVVILFPLAWLALGAVIYGREIAEEAGRSRRGLKFARRWARSPWLVRRALTAGRDVFKDRFGELVDGLRLLTRIGLPTMLVFCLLFAVMQTIGVWLFGLERALIGPRDTATFWIPFSIPISALNDAVQTVVLVCLLAAAVDRVLAVQAAREASASGETTGAVAETGEASLLEPATPLDQPVSPEPAAEREQPSEPEAVPESSTAPASYLASESYPVPAPSLDQTVPFQRISPDRVAADMSWDADTVVRIESAEPPPTLSALVEHGPTMPGPVAVTPIVSAPTVPAQWAGPGLENADALWEADTLAAPVVTEE